MSSDRQFTATGPTEIGFQCNGANIGVGGFMVGNKNGVEARCGNALGENGAAVHAQNDTHNANGVIATAHIGTNAFGIWASSAEGFAGNFDGKVNVNGGLHVNGRLTSSQPKSAAIRVADGSLRLLYAVESPESWFEDFGFGRLSDGYARVELDEMFASVIAAIPYHVFLTQYDRNDGLYVTEREASGFTVRSTRSADTECEFSYRVTAKRKDAAEVRFEETDVEPGRKTLP
ncbi:MAG TPA: hypothetical protein VGP26_25525 [Actinophytocola sp.]|jgi:hypothetical protein|nr:hypothetical protein [Actinophytocola sp.]